MKPKWMVLSVVVALCLASWVVTVRAQERSAPAPEGIAPGSADAPADEVSAADDDTPELDGLDLLLAADAGGPDPDRGGAGPRRGPGALRMRELHETLDLSEDQKARLADIHDRRARAAIPIQADLRIAGLDLRKLIRADRPDRQAIDAQIDRIAGLRARLQKSRVGSLLEARAVLTPAQQKLMRESHGGMGGRRGGMRMRMMGDPMSRQRR